MLGSTTSSSHVADNALNIQLHDFSGHPFQADLSRALAQRGYLVDHAYSTQYSSGKGRLRREVGDPASLSFTGITTHHEFEKYRPRKRVVFEIGYARAWCAHVNNTNPDLVIACNVPLLSLAYFRRFAARRRQRWLLWHQDIFSLALSEEIDRKVPAFAAPAARGIVNRLEKNVVSSASGVIAIGDGFKKHYLERWGLERETEVIPNWAPVNDIVPSSTSNSWSTQQIPSRGELLLLYAGTLGRKHNPRILIDLIEAAHEQGIDARLVVVSEGEGAEAVKAAETTAKDSLQVLPFQPASEFSEVLASADVLVAILEPSASEFSIPSKVLSYLAAGRPILGIMPESNPAAADIRTVGGYVAEPTNDGVAAAAAWLRRLRDDPSLRAQVGASAREYAVQRFGIESIADRFENVIRKVATVESPPGA